MNDDEQACWDEWPTPEQLLQRARTRREKVLDRGDLLGEAPILDRLIASLSDLEPKGE